MPFSFIYIHFCRFQGEHKNECSNSHIYIKSVIVKYLPINKIKRPYKASSANTEFHTEAMDVHGTWHSSHLTTHQTMRSQHCSYRPCAPRGQPRVRCIQASIPFCPPPSPRQRPLSLTLWASSPLRLRSDLCDTCRPGAQHPLCHLSPSLSFKKSSQTRSALPEARVCFLPNGCTGKTDSKTLVHTSLQFY